MWKDITNFEGYYQVSDEGQVRSVPRTIITSNNHTRYYKGKLLKPIIRNHRYLGVSLYINNQKNYYMIHQLVAQEFMIKPRSATTIKHLDGNDFNNCVSNLKWVTHVEKV